MIVGEQLKRLQLNHPGRASMAVFPLGQTRLGGALLSILRQFYLAQKRFGTAANERCLIGAGREFTPRRGGCHRHGRCKFVDEGAERDLGMQRRRNRIRKVESMAIGALNDALIALGFGGPLGSGFPIDNTNRRLGVIFFG